MRRVVGSPLHSNSAQVPFPFPPTVEVALSTQAQPQSQSQSQSQSRALDRHPRQVDHTSNYSTGPSTSSNHVDVSPIDRDLDDLPNMFPPPSSGSGSGSDPGPRSQRDGTTDSHHGAIDWDARVEHPDELSGGDRSGAADMERGRRAMGSGPGSGMGSGHGFPAEDLVEMGFLSEAEALALYASSVQCGAMRCGASCRLGGRRERKTERIRWLTGTIRSVSLGTRAIGS